VKCWGGNEYGQLGDGSTTDRGSAIFAAGLESGMQAISTGETHTCALSKAGAVWCWGDNAYGQLGDGTTKSHLVPTRVSGLESGVKAIATGTWISCALRTSGAVLCWGDNEFGGVGDGIETQNPRLLPTQVSGLTSGVTSIAANGFHVCAIAAQGAVICWGNNTDGPLGDDSQTDRFAPVQVFGLDSPQISLGLGYSHTCSISSGGAAHCWGLNVSGQLGNGTHSPFDLVPTPVVGLASNIVEMAGGFDHECALLGGGFVFCWGSNARGELGNGVLEPQWLPTVVPGLGAPRKAY
jgi:alpha-tubulin suppressor-like RCC1 family protein